jgi:hypothetical protein
MEWSEVWTNNSLSWQNPKWAAGEKNDGSGDGNYASDWRRPATAMRHCPFVSAAAAFNSSATKQKRLKRQNKRKNAKQGSPPTQKMTPINEVALLAGGNASLFVCSDARFPPRIIGSQQKVEGRLTETT